MFSRPDRNDRADHRGFSKPNSLKTLDQTCKVCIHHHPQFINEYTEFFQSLRDLSTVAWPVHEARIKIQGADSDLRNPMLDPCSCQQVIISWLYPENIVV